MSGNLQAFQSRNYRIYFIGQLFSMMGSWMQITVQGWLVYRLSHSAMWLGIITFSSQLPAFLSSPLAGVMADQVDRRKLLIWVQLLGMIQALTLSYLVLRTPIQLSTIALLAVFLGVINAFDITTRHAITVDLVGKEHLNSALNLNSIIVNSSRMIGPAIAGILIVYVNEGWCFFINGLSFGTVILSLLFVQTPPLKTAMKSFGTLLLGLQTQIREGISYAFSQRPIRNLIFLSTFLSFFGFPFQVLLPVFAKTILHGNSKTLGFLISSAGLGAIIGVIGTRRSTTLHTLVGVGLSLLTLGLSTNFILSLASCFGIGFFLMAAFPAINYAIQSQVEERFRGRVLSLYTMSFLGTMPLGSLLSGTLADRIGAPLTQALFGGVVLLAALTWTIQGLPHFRRFAFISQKR